MSLIKVLNFMLFAWTASVWAQADLPGAWAGEAAAPVAPAAGAQPPRQDLMAMRSLIHAMGTLGNTPGIAQYGNGYFTVTE